LTQADSIYQSSWSSV